MAWKGDDRFAVKIISRLKHSLEFSQRFLPRELDILRKVQHPHIVKVYEVVDFKNEAYIFMECIERGDLLDYIKDRIRLNEKEAFRYFSQLLSAIKYLHELKICHRDVKCENILLTENDSVKIIDFGFSKICVNAAGKRTLSDTYCGSTAYASPEVLLGIPYNPMLYDVWSLGCVLFIMVAGTMPFNDSNVTEMMRNQLKRRLKFHGVTSLLSHDVKSLIRHMLEPDVTKRATTEQVSRSPWIVHHKEKIQTLKQQSGNVVPKLTS